MQLIEKTFNKEDVEVLFDMYKNSIVKHPYLNPYNIYARNLFLAFKFKVLSIKNHGYIMSTNQNYLFRTFFYPGIFNDENLYKDIYITLKHKKFVHGFAMSKTLHFYTDSQALLSVYDQVYNSLNRDVFVDVIYDNSVKRNRSTRHRINNNMKKAIESGIRIYFMDKMEPYIFREWYTNCYTYAYNNKPPFTYSQLHNYTNYLLERNLQKFIIAKLDDRVVGAIAILMDQYSNIGWFNLEAIGSEGREKGAGYLLMDTAINVINEYNKVFELYGKSYSDLDSKHIGILNFKKVFGTEIEIPYFLSNTPFNRFTNNFISLGRRIIQNEKQ